MIAADRLPKVMKKVGKLGKISLFILKNTNLRTVGRAFTYIRQHGYHALRWKLQYKFSHRAMDASKAILSTEIPWYSADSLTRLDKPLTGSFRFPIPGLRCLEFQTVTKGVFPDPLELRLLDWEGNLVREVEAPGAHVLDGDYTTFSFDPIRESKGERYRFILTATGKHAPSLFHHSDTVMPDVLFDQEGTVNCRLYADEWDGDSYALWIGKNECAGKELEAQRGEQFVQMPKISILVPMYNTPLPVFKEMVESVRSQTYENWELCLVDGGSTNPDLLQMAEALALADSRILFHALGQNLGIAGNSNAAADLASGNFLALLDHDDTLAPFALREMVVALNTNPEADFFYSDEDKIDETGLSRFDAYFKPDFAPDTLRSYNYICHFTMMSTMLFRAAGAFRKGFDGSQDYDLFLRATEKAKQIVHVPKILYHWRVSENSTARSGEAKPYVAEASCRALTSHLERIGMKGTVGIGLLPSVYDVRPAIDGTPLVSIIIPNKDHVPDLKTCLESIQAKTTWSNYEILVVENNSKEAATFRYYDQIEANPKIRLVKWADGFNFAAINNFAAREARGEYLLLLNNDTEIIEPDWLTRMLEHAQRKEVGAVGAMLYYPDDTIQHAGVVIGLNSLADHSFKGVPRRAVGYFSRTHIVQDVSAVTGACLMMRREVYDAVKGLNEDFAVAFNDIDLCMRIRRKGLLIVWTPHAKLYHHESKSRGYEDTPAKHKRFLREINLFYSIWGRPHQLQDPYYNRNLTMEGAGYELSV